jgi:serine phosphatase RsbU (regulator of sigma subunit)/pSer/pThr/pTyr-binding forkhead associated (FHA) protein
VPEASQTRIRFTVYQPGLAPQRITLNGEGLITLGRASECTVPIKDRFLSRRHAEVALDRGRWYVRDCGSVNGTMLNGMKVVEPAPLRSGDRIALGDSEVVFHDDDSSSQLIAVDSESPATNLSIAVNEDSRGGERSAILVSLALEFLADRGMDELFEFILDKVVKTLRPSRAALALLGNQRQTFKSVRLRRQDPNDPTDLLISKTLLREVIDNRKVVSYFDTDQDQDQALAKAASIIAQHIRSAVCAPLVVGDAVLGVLYIDYVSNRGVVREDDVRLLAQIANFAAVTLERTRLREEVVAKAVLDEELRTAYKIQSRLLPASLPRLDSYVFAGSNRPCKTVSGDYYDVVVRPDGRIYFVIADVSGKGITAALVMSSVATAFQIFTRNDPKPSELMREINATLAPKTSPSKFVTTVAGVLDPSTGVIEFANAGHVAPLVVARDGVKALRMTDIVVGIKPEATYRDQSITLGPGESLVLFTDGVTEAENASEEQLGLDPILTLLGGMGGEEAARLLDAIDTRVHDHIGDVPAGDDVTMLAVSRTG